MTPMEEIALRNATEHLASLQKMQGQLGTAGSAELQRMINDAQARVNVLTATAATPVQTSPSSVEQRLASIEKGIADIAQLVREVAVPALSEAGHVGAALLAGIGEGLTPEHQQFVQAQQASGKLPTFFTTQDCKDAAAIYVGAWMAHEAQQK